MRICAANCGPGHLLSICFRMGNYIGDDAYIDFVPSAFGNQLSRAEFESQVKSDMELNRLQALITGGVTVSDKAVRDAYKTDGTKVKFDYVVISADDVRKGINPSDADLAGILQDERCAVCVGGSGDAQDSVCRV